MTAKTQKEHLLKTIEERFQNVRGDFGALGDFLVFVIF
jgi:hypothetical protein